jgi:anti-sigma-K factor RskA
MQKDDHDQIAELIPEFALGILADDDAALVKQHLQTCAACQQEVASYDSVVDALALAAPSMAPPAHLRAQLFEQIQETPEPESPPAPSPSWWQASISSVRSFLNGPRWRPALVLVIIAILVGAIFFWQQSRNEPLDQFALTPTDAAPGAEGVIAVFANGRDATLTVSGLQVLSPAEQYQLWLIVDGQRASGAIFSVADDGSAAVPIDSERPLSDYAAFGITIEPAGGSPGPTGQRVLGFNL